MQDNKGLWNVQLADRILWFDGLSSFDPTELTSALKRYDIKHVTDITDDVIQYNQLVGKESQLTVKQTCLPLDYNWAIPDQYNNLDVIQYISDIHCDILRRENLTDEADAREQRLAEELALFKQKQLFPVLRAIIYIINTLNRDNIVWGVGRGSSVSSYVLYVIGVHDIDSYLYDLDIHDFLH